jgi:hypothetical protein
VAWAVAVALGVALVGALVLRAPPEAPAPPPAPPVAAAVGGELPPDWVTRPLTVDAAAGVVWIVGKAGPSRTKEQLLGAATDDAVTKLVDFIERSARPDAAKVGDHDDELFRERLRKRFDETWGIYAAPVRSDVHVTERPDGFVGAFRFRVSSSAVDKAVAELTETVAPADLTVGRLRMTETVALQPREALVVVGVKGVGASLGAEPGDFIVSVANEPVRTLADFDAIVQREYSLGSLVVVVNRKGVQTSLVWRKPIQR